MHQGQDDLTIDGFDVSVMRDAGDSVDIGLHNRLLDKSRGLGGCT